MFKIVILAGSAHNFNFSVNSYMLVKVARLKTFEEVMKGKNSAAVVDRQENKARSKHRRVLMNSQNKTKLKNGEGSLERSERNMDEDPILNDATTVSRRNTSQGTTCNEQRALRTCGRIYKRQERDDRIRITANFKYYQDTHGQFKARMVAQFGERFFYRGGSWDGEESKRYSKYHIKKSMRFLEANMQQ